MALFLAGCGEPSPPASPASLAFLEGWAEAIEGCGTTEGGLPRRIRRVRDGAEMVLIEGGTFWMGRVDDDAKHVDDERPRHRVTLTPFYLDVTEVTNARFLAFVEATNLRTGPEDEGKALVFQPSESDDSWPSQPGVSWRHPLAGAVRQDDWERHPVVLVSWFDAMAFCEWAGATLPTEAQYELVLRQGRKGDVFPWGDRLPPPARYGNFMDRTFQTAFGDRETGAIPDYDDGFLRTAPVGSFPAGVFGTHDISGNVWEWCLDGFSEDYYARFDGVPSTNPLCGPCGDTRTRRGGGWMTGKGGRLRCSWRGIAGPEVCRDYVGFRCARTVPTVGTEGP